MSASIATPSYQVVLVVDDEPFVLSAISGILVRAGFQVLQASHPTEALALARERQERIDLILCDVIMPFLSGPQLADQLLTLHPESRRLFMAGLPDNPEIAELVRQGFAFLPKPFGAQELLAKVRDVLAQPEGSGNGASR